MSEVVAVAPTPSLYDSVADDNSEVNSVHSNNTPLNNYYNSEESRVTPETQQINYAESSNNDDDKTSVSSELAEQTQERLDVNGDQTDDTVGDSRSLDNVYDVVDDAARADDPAYDAGNGIAEYNGVRSNEPVSMVFDEVPQNEESLGTTEQEENKLNQSEERENQMNQLEFSEASQSEEANKDLELALNQQAERIYNDVFVNSNTLKYDEEKTEDTATRSTETTSSAKPRTSTSGKFVMRSVSRADPLHVVQSILQSAQNNPDSNPELEELVKYIKVQNENQQNEDTTASETNQKIRSWITSNLVQQFNKEAETGKEAGQLLMPKRSYIAPSATQTMTSRNAAAQQRKNTTETSLTADSSSSVKEPESNQSNGEQIKMEKAATPETETVKVSDTVDSISLKSAVQSQSVALQQAQADNKSASLAPKPSTVNTNGPSNNLNVSARSSISSPPATPDGALSPTSEAAVPGVPNWKAEIERRKQTKDYLVTQRPEQPIKLYETPAWKKALQEKNKTRKSTGSSSSEPLSAEIQQENEAEWKTEIRQILRQKSALQDDPTQQTPEWQRLNDK